MSDPQQLHEKIAREILWAQENDHPVSSLMDAIMPLVLEEKHEAERRGAEKALREACDAEAQENGMTIVLERLSKQLHYYLPAGDHTEKRTDDE